MSKRATVIEVDSEERAVLESWVRAGTSEQRLGLRARIVLAAAAGRSTTAIAQELAVRTATVSNWRTRFAQKRVAGLRDAPRPGKPARYTQETERRVLAMLDETPPPAMPPGTAACWRSRWATCPPTRYGGCCAVIALACSGATPGA